MGTLIATAPMVGTAKGVTEVRPEVILLTIAGTTEVCFRHYLSSLRDAGPEIIKSGRHALIKLTSVSDETAAKWFRGQCLPIGLNLLRLRFFLESLGYQVAELDQMRQHRKMPALYWYAKAVAHRQLDRDEEAGSFGLGRDEFLRWVLGKRLPAARRYKIIAGRVSELGKQWPELAETKTAVPAITPASRQDWHAVLLESLAVQIRGLIPLVELVLSDEFTADERKRLRELAITRNGRSNAVFDLSNLLGRACGERARKEIR